MLGEILLTVAIVSVGYSFYKWATINKNFFKKRNIKFMKPSFLFGNTGGLFFQQNTAIEFAQKLYKAFPNESINGFFDFREPQYMVRNPEAIKRIAIKDFDHFEDHRNILDENIDKVFGNMLFMMRGEKWRNMRATLSPAFTGSKMRQMFEFVTECANNMVNQFIKRAETGEKINIESRDLFTKYTNDVIATCAFGLKIDSLANPKNEFYQNGMMLTNTGSAMTAAALFLIMKLPGIARALNFIFASSPQIKSFRKTIMDTMEYRKANKVHRSDMINILMQIKDGTLKQQEDEKDEAKGFATVDESEVGKRSVIKRTWSDDELLAQCMIFFVAGFDTSSTLLTLASYELAINPNIQQKLYEEITEVEQQLNGKRIDYDVLQKMKYLDQVISETLRKWPPVVQLDRRCVKDYEYDDEKYNFKIEKGTALIFPTYGIHNDSQYWPDPEKFDPERFSDENKCKIQPGTYIPFGIGPRNCIGSRFALMEAKAILYYILLNFSFEPNENTQIPLKFEKSFLSMHTQRGLHLQLKPRKK